MLDRALKHSPSTQETRQLKRSTAAVQCNHSALSCVLLSGAQEGDSKAGSCTQDPLADSFVGDGAYRIGSAGWLPRSGLFCPSNTTLSRQRNKGKDARTVAMFYKVSSHYLHRKVPKVQAPECFPGTLGTSVHYRPEQRGVKWFRVKPHNSGSQLCEIQIHLAWSAHSTDISRGRHIPFSNYANLA